MMKNEIPLGKPIEGDAKRDAIHIAIAPVVADERLAPGQHIGFVNGSVERVRAGEKRIGIVDPFLTDWIEKDQRFFMLLYPNTITSLRHEWAHPAFANVSYNETSHAELVIKNTAMQCGRSVESLIEDAKEFVETGTSKYVGTDDFNSVDSWEEFWCAFEQVTGMKARDGERYGFYSCAC